ncbi:hypothetical protein CYD30_12780 [Kosakonia cowanii]|nr:hypothetical protein CYD30_12780 [Kosakonia cowanii]
MGKSISYIKLGSAERKILIMSPVMPEWDNGIFFQPLTNYFLGQGYSILIIDTLSLPLEENETINRFCQRWANELKRFGPFEIVGGGALGGVVAQLLATYLPQEKLATLLLISAPNIIDSVLCERLRTMARLARAGDFNQAMHLLNYFILPEDGRPIPSLTSLNESGSEQQRKRLFLT